MNKKLNSVCKVVSKYFLREEGMEDSFDDFEVKKKINTGPKIATKNRKNKLKKPPKRSKGQKDIRSLIKKNELVSYSQDFNQVCKQSGVDVDAEQLQLAIALSKSLKEVKSSSEEVEIQNKQLSSQERSAKIRTTLQEYGFKVNKSKISLSTNKRRKYKKHSKLLHISNEERLQNIAYKYSKVLSSNICNSNNEDRKCIYLKHTIFYKSTNIPYETIKNDDLFYIRNLIDKPTHKTCLLRDWSEIPGRPASPKPKHNDIVFETIQCSQEELDGILSGSIETAQIIINNKQYVKETSLITDSCNDEISDIIKPIPYCSNNSKTTKDTYTSWVLETKVTEMDDFTNREKFNSIKEIECVAINMDKSVNDSPQRSLKIESQNLHSGQYRSESPDLFDDEVSTIIEDINESVIIKTNGVCSTKGQNDGITVKTNEVCCIVEDNNISTRQSISKHDNYGTIYMDLTECAHNIDSNLNIPNTDITKRKSNDLMDITECVNVKSNNNIDVLSSGDIDKKAEDDYELVDLTQVPNLVNNLPAMEKSSTINSISLDDTVIYDNVFTKTVQTIDLEEPIILFDETITKDVTKDKTSYKAAANSEHNSCNDDCNIDLTQGSEHNENNSSLRCPEYDDCGLASLKPNSGALINDQDNISLKSVSFDNDIGQDEDIDLTQDSEKSFEISEVNNEITYPGKSFNDKTLLEDVDHVVSTAENNSILIVENKSLHSEFVEENNEDDKIDLTQVTEEFEERNNANGYSFVHKNNSKLGKINNISIDYDEMFDEVTSEHRNISKNSSIEKDDLNASNPSINSEVFEISDKEINYSIHHSIHENFNIDLETKCSLNRSLSDGNVPTVNLSKLLSPIKERHISLSNTPIKINRDAIIQTPKNNEYIIKTGDVTPMADYESMTTPERNKELEKYGLKPFKRKRAIQLLTYVYNQTHPVIENCSPEEGPSKRFKRDDKNSSPKKNSKSPKKCLNFGSDLNKENDIFVVTKEIPDIKNIECDPKEWVFENKEKAKVHSCRVPLHIAFHNYVSCRKLLKEAILRYEPVNIDIIHKQLVNDGHKYNPKDLLKFMDRKCITVKTVENNSRNKKKIG